MSLGKTRDGVEVHVNTMVSEWPGCIRVSTRRHDRPIAESYVRVPARPVAVVVDSGGGIVEQKSPTPPQNWVLLIVADTERCYMVWNTPLAGANPRFIGRKHGALTYAAFALRRENAGYFFTELGSHPPLYHLPYNG